MLLYLTDYHMESGHLALAEEDTPLAKKQTEKPNS